MTSFKSYSRLLIDMKLTLFFIDIDVTICKHPRLGIDIIARAPEVTP